MDDPFATHVPLKLSSTGGVCAAETCLPLAGSLPIDHLDFGITVEKGQTEIRGCATKREQM